MPVIKGILQYGSLAERATEGYNGKQYDHPRFEAGILCQMSSKVEDVIAQIDSVVDTNWPGESAVHVKYKRSEGEEETGPVSFKVTAFRNFWAYGPNGENIEPNELKILEEDSRQEVGIEFEIRSNGSAQNPGVMLNIKGVKLFELVAPACPRVFDAL